MDPVVKVASMATHYTAEDCQVMKHDVGHTEQILPRQNFCSNFEMKLLCRIR